MKEGIKIAYTISNRSRDMMIIRRTLLFECFHFELSSRVRNFEALSNASVYNHTSPSNDDILFVGSASSLHSKKLQIIH